MENTPTVHHPNTWIYNDVVPLGFRSGAHKPWECPMCMNNLIVSTDCHCCRQCCEASGWECGNISVNSYPKELPADAVETAHGTAHVEDTLERMDAAEGFPPVMEFEFACAICNKGIPDENIFAMVLVWPEIPENIIGGELVEQTWWVHRGCFVQMLHPFYREMRDE